MSTYAIKADKFFLPAGPQLGGFLMVEDGVFGAWQADEPLARSKIIRVHGLHRVWWTPISMVSITMPRLTTMPRVSTSARPSLLVVVPPAGCLRPLPTAWSRSRTLCRYCTGGRRARARVLRCSYSGYLLEGPFFTMKHVGAQNPAYLIDRPRKFLTSGRRPPAVVSSRAPWRPSAMALPLMPRL